MDASVELVRDEARLALRLRSEHSSFALYRDVVVDRTSGQKILDLAAVRIVEMGGPYAPFPPNISRDTDILYITRTWSFSPGDSLTSR